MAKHIFETNPNLDVIYTTSDGVNFFTPNNAENYAKTLKNKKVDKVTRAAYLISVKKSTKKVEPQK